MPTETPAEGQSAAAIGSGKRPPAAPAKRLERSASIDAPERCGRAPAPSRYSANSPQDIAIADPEPAARSQSDPAAYAGFWIRTAAHLIDGTLLTLIILPMNLYVYGAEYVTHTKLIAGPFDFVISWVLPAIAIILFWKYREATPGKMWLGIRVVDAQSLGHPSTRQYVIRYFGYIVSIVPLLLGLFWVAWDPRKQAWHDKLARTVVLRAS